MGPDSRKMLSPSLGLHYAARITTHWPRGLTTLRPVPLPESRTAIHSAAPANAAQKEGLLAPLCGKPLDDVSHLLSSTCAKDCVSICPLLGPFL